MSEKATLMNKNTPILEIEIENSSIMNFYNVLSHDMLPIQLQDNIKSQSINQWFQSRLLPDKREGMKEARMQFRFFDKEKYFFSLSDQYWVRYKDSDTWEKYNFFTNKYSNEVGKIFFEPWNVKKDELKYPSPDRTTNGVLRKRWIQDETMQSYLIKQGSKKYHQEPLSEVMASMMLKQMGMLPFVEYSLVVDGLSFCSKCRNFVTEDTEFVPAIAIYNKRTKEDSISKYEHFLSMCDLYHIKEAETFMEKMILVDYVICNTDRHFGNFGFLRSAITGEILGFAPLFDFGSAYWGTTNDVERKSSRHFAEEEALLVAKAAGDGRLQVAKSGRAMMDLLKAYPIITNKKKNAIQNLINEVDQDIAKFAKTQSKKDDRDDEGNAFGNLDEMFNEHKKPDERKSTNQETRSTAKVASAAGKGDMPKLQMNMDNLMIN